jgi:hypothetical protein
MEKRKEYDAEKLADLLAEVKAATGPDRDLDCAIEKWLYDSGRNFYGHLEFVPTFTASIDAALALVAKVAPELQEARLQIGLSNGDYCNASLYLDTFTQEPDEVYIAPARTAPLAILAALLSALSALPNTQKEGT